jgi:hypothetical protein
MWTQYKIYRNACLLCSSADLFLKGGLVSLWHYICLSAIQPLNQLTDAHDTSRERYAIGRYPKTVLPISCHHSKEHCGLANFALGGGGWGGAR